MGSKQSSYAEKNITTDVINKNMLNSFTRNLNEQSSNCSGTQYAEFLAGPQSDIVGCDLNINQKMGLDCKAQAYFASQNENSLKADIQNSLDQSLKSEQKNENPSFTLVPYSNQSNTDLVNVQNHIKNIVERNLTTENLNKCLAIAKGAQEGKITILGKYTCKEGKGINLTQDMVVEQYAQCGADIVNKTLTDDKFISDLKTKAESSQSNLTSGYGAVFALVFFLIIIGAAAYFMFKRSPAGMASDIGKNNVSSEIKGDLINQLISKGSK